MEKNIASYDLSDMMVEERMHEQSRKFLFKQQFTPIRKAAEKVIGIFERMGKSAKRMTRSSHQLVYQKPLGFTNTASAVYAIVIASTVISFFWLSLLFSVTT